MSKQKNSPFDSELGWKLRVLRTNAKITQEKLGELLGVKYQQIQKYETGFSQLSPGKVFQCAEIFGVPVAYFFPAQNLEDRHETKDLPSKMERL